jgi:hypothetical protein
MNNHTKLLRVIVASPSDVLAERKVVPLVIEEINRSIGADRGVRLEVIRWETDTHPGFHRDGPQGLIDPILRIEDSDLLVGIFWKRFGTPTGDESSGTEHEIRRAVESWTEKGRPQVFIYFNEKSATPRSPQEANQWAQVLQFRDQFPSEGLCSSYQGISHFERLLRTHLTNYLRNQFLPRLPEGNVEAAPNISASSNYFAVQKQVIEEHARGYVGRGDARSVVERFIGAYSCGYIFVHGGPGQGKTSFCCDLIREYGYPHHLAGISGGRSDLRLILRSLLAQVTVSMHSVPQIPDSLAALSKLWEEVLTIRGQKERIVIVLDGLDELPNENFDDLQFIFPERLPEGVFLILALRPGRLLEALRDQASAVSHVEYELEPLGPIDLEKLIRGEIPTVSRAALLQIETVALGNPLYVRSLLNELKIHPDFDLSDLPPTLEGFFRRATRFVKIEGKCAKSVLGLLSVARMPLSISQMQHSTLLPQRDIYDVVHVLRPFLIETGGAYRFYHRSFLEFVVDKLLFPEELLSAHAMIAEWLTDSSRENTEYRWQFLAYHLLESGNYKALEQEISSSFLAEKSRRYGYAVLDDIECLIKVMLITGDASAVEKCVNLVEELASTVGESLIQDASRALRRSPLPSHSSDRTFVPQQTAAIAGLDFYVTSTAAADVSADFYEIVPTKTGCCVAIGDAPGRGLKSAFVGRFIGHLFKRRAGELPKFILEKINVLLSTFDYFEQVSMMCVSLDLMAGVFSISNAGHPALAHFSRRRHRCDPLWVPGEPLHDSARQTRRLSDYENYLAELDTGDILVLLTDGLLEYHRMDGQSYGYKFTRIVEEMAELPAREIGEAIISDWRAHSGDEDYRDDMILMVISIRDKFINKIQSVAVPTT